jgi:pimeloyl-ACP methyl ester carboxylesterase
MKRVNREKLASSLRFFVIPSVAAMGIAPFALAANRPDSVTALALLGAGGGLACAKNFEPGYRLPFVMFSIGQGLIGAALQVPSDTDGAGLYIRSAAIAMGTGFMLFGCFSATDPGLSLKIEQGIGHAVGKVKSIPQAIADAFKPKTIGG